MSGIEIEGAHFANFDYGLQEVFHGFGKNGGPAFGN
jgi:hypothetical protein